MSTDQEQKYIFQVNMYLCWNDFFNWKWQSATWCV